MCERLAAGLIVVNLTFAYQFQRHRIVHVVDQYFHNYVQVRVLTPSLGLIVEGGCQFQEILMESSLACQLRMKGCS